MALLDWLDVYEADALAERETEVAFLRRTVAALSALVADYAALYHRHDGKRARALVAQAETALAWTAGGEDE